MGNAILYVDGVRCERQYSNLATEPSKLVELFKNEREGKYAVRHKMHDIYICEGMNTDYKRYNDLA